MCFDLIDLWFFLNICEVGMIMSGVEWIYIMLQVVSECICGMEDEFGVLLLYWIKLGVQVIDVGCVFEYYVCIVLQQIDYMCGELQ